MFRRALEEGIVDPARMLQAGMRGSLYGEDDEGIPSQLGVETIPWTELATLSPEQLAERAAARVGDGPAFLSFDVDFVDCAFCPGTGTPEVAGPSSFQAMQYLRALAGIPFVGYDVVEVAPPVRRPRAADGAVRGERDVRDAVDGGAAQAGRAARVTPAAACG